jgi:hypothetical protein
MLSTLHSQEESGESIHAKAQGHAPGWKRIRGGNIRADSRGRHVELAVAEQEAVKAARKKYRYVEVISVVAPK